MLLLLVPHMSDYPLRSDALFILVYATLQLRNIDTVKVWGVGNHPEAQFLRARCQRL
jgi:hypothetical protein